MRQRVAAIGVIALMATCDECRRAAASGLLGHVGRGTGCARRPNRPAPPVFGPQFTIAHQDPALTLTRTVNGAPATIKYVLDGSEVTSRTPGRLCEADSAATWTAAWDGQTVTLSMVGAVPPNGKAVKTDVTNTLTAGFSRHASRRSDSANRRPGRARARAPPSTSVPVLRRCPLPRP